MTSQFIKAEQIVEAAGLLLQREIVLPRLVWTQPSAAFVGALDDTITLRIPAVRTAGTRTMRASDDLNAADLTETKVAVKLNTHVYDLLNITDEQLTLDVIDFARQVLNPQMRAVAEGMENVIATALAAVDWDADDVVFVEASDEPFDVAVDAAKALNKLNVPRAERVLVLGANVEGAFLKSDKLSRVDASGTDSALREATIARLAGFTIVGSNAIGENDAYAFHRTAIAFANVAPALPDGATMKAKISTEGLALRYLRDYNPTNSTGPVDRSLVDAFVGAASVDDEDSSTNKRGVKIAFTGEDS